MHKIAKTSRAVSFVLMIGLLSFFADFTYEGSRSILGPYLALLQASGTAVAVVTGFGELLGYGSRLISGPLADRTGKFWPITIFGYIVQMSSVPLLAFAANWQTAASLIILERVGKAIRNPPRDVMLSHAAKQIGYGKAFGVHEALDQFGALFGPLAVAAVLATRGDYRFAFAALFLPGVICLSLLLVARWLYPRPEEMEITEKQITTRGFPRAYWVYLAGAVLVAAGFADFPLIAYNFQRTGSITGNWIPISYAIAMAVSGTGSLVFGRLFDRFWHLDACALDGAFDLVCSPGLSGRVLGRAPGCSFMGTRDGGARINRARSGGTNGPAAPASLRLRTVYGRLWCLFGLSAAH
jgi:MFS family permease